MTTRKSILLAALLIKFFFIASLAPTVVAADSEPCPIRQNDWGYWQLEGDCWFLDKQPEVGSLPPPPEFAPRPDLEPVDADIDIGGGGIFIEIKTQNIGLEDSSDFEIEVVVVLQQGGKNSDPSARLVNRVPGLNVGDDRRDHIGIAKLEYRDGDVVILSAVVDTADDNVEADENNNLLIETCTIDLSNLLDPCDD